MAGSAAVAAAVCLGLLRIAGGSSGDAEGYWAGATMGLSELTRATSAWAMSLLR